MRPQKRCAGFTLIELIVVIIVVAVVIIGALMLPALGMARASSRQIHDATQVRGIHQGMVLWVPGNDDSYPLPSRLDKDDATVAEIGREKDTTANIMSIMIYNGFFSPELCISPAESSPNIRLMTNYSYSKPSAATSPSQALWDPAFAADFSGGKVGNLSYAHTLPADERLKKTWANTLQAAEAALGNRGPEIASMSTSKRGERTFHFARAESNTYLIHGGRSTWEGNIAYNDNHVSFETRLDPEASPYKDAAGKQWFDCLFFDEPDDPSAVNNYLGIFTKAGATGAEYKAIWD
jgi:prepilin-type N-terminal cleavage/methylation domain-containing protein